VTNPAAVTVEITSADADASDNTLNPGLVAAVDATQNLYFNLYLDYYCSETTWKLKNSAGTTVQQGGPTTARGRWRCRCEHLEGSTAWTEPMDCYQMWLYDAYGDGLESTNYGPHADGSWELKDGGFNVLWSGAADFGADEKSGLDVNAVAGIDESTNNGGVSVYPNPTSGDATVTIELANPASVSIMVYDVLGKVVMGYDRQMGSGMNLFPMSTSELESGVYYFNITINGNTEIRKVTVSK
jgi:hypothetical protein